MTMRSLILPLLSVCYFANVSAVMADDVDRSNKNSNKGYSKLKKTMKVLGGADAIIAAQSQLIVANVRRFNPEQTLEPGDKPLHTADLTRVLTKDLNAQRYLTEWSLSTRYPTINQFDFTEIINGDHGMVDGVDGFFGLPPQTAMISTRLGARIKLYEMGSPLSLMKKALTQSEELQYRGKSKIKGRPHYQVTMPGWDSPIHLFIDVKTKRLTKAITLEDDPIYGDTRFSVEYRQWARVDGFQLPYKVIYTVNDRRIAIETRDTIRVNVPLTDEQFSIPSQFQMPINEDQYSWGLRSSQWFNRYLALGVPFDIDQRHSDTVSIVEIAPKLYHLLGVTHNSLVIEMNDFLIIADPVLYDDRTQSILRALRDQWPEKPVKYVIASHFHGDHIGGIRGYAAEGATLIVGDDTQEHYEDILVAPHTVYPDVLSENPLDVDIITVDDDEPYEITDGQRVVRLYDIANRHSTGMLVPYIDDVKAIFTSDLYIPGGALPIQPLFLFWAMDLKAGLMDLDIPIDTVIGAHGGVVPYTQFLSDVDSSQ